ncbi:heme d1 biosynthesis radical SAM protein NirJ [Cupriavidus oxalaticus]|uniref:Pre-heme d1 synthase n=1 Tax=Cupriavidus oxalaticus TaxID=96344 RepID=A0A375GJR0_9BURK|nr:heme d1 biosynthesis radical SAM protein NirJ [Cupriavidus oxalaticus]QEZ43808.1 heme d1 biosynthesis radical SAM protein NirJ [Cupriavidus oxalaticus]QRQ84784.1 heme d1 biosynthesis radical SAM protein NirJ [Cupriavidus oxalaticus]QRQ91127.1 heme d1 biosynthesis radical SAM protein NirJ [Cupriavidus oxalaticus]WQD85672.1 heme d1 biosynthesis radical SAM protein NirJ [Cupriavidus oxalaticus]SPC20822.1 Heme d1 biosynthesis protein (NirJ) [Cupriavidus oxalaticus]
MFRLSRFMEALRDAGPVPPARKAAGPVVIWNLIRRCNLNCRHCYATSADTDFKGELDTAEALRVLAQLRDARVPALILSGGEPLLRPDLYDIAAHARALGFHLSLSSNGTLLDAGHAARLAAAGFDYVGVSLDGLPATHDRFRRSDGAFAQALAGLRAARAAGLRVGVRMTLTEANAAQLPDLVALTEREGIDKFYLSHFNYAGRARSHRAEDARHARTRAALDWLFEHVWARTRAGHAGDFVTGNNDADGVYLLYWIAQRFPHRVADMRQRLEQWGGNATGVGVANIDNLGNVHPDTMWWHVTLGNVRERPFGEIWASRADPLMAGLASRPRPLQGRCADCAQRAICNGNTRVRALALTGNAWAEDPGCYLSDTEIANAPGTEVAA